VICSRGEKPAREENGREENWERKKPGAHLAPGATGGRGWLGYRISILYLGYGIAVSYIYIYSSSILPLGIE